MPNYRLTPDAQADLIEIRRFTVEQWGAAQSQKFLSELRQTMRVLAKIPPPGQVQGRRRRGRFELPVCQSRHLLHEP